MSVYFWLRDYDCTLICKSQGTTVSSRDSAASPSPSWEGRPRPPRSWSSGWSAASASGRTRWAQWGAAVKWCYYFSSPECTTVDDKNLIWQFWLCGLFIHFFSCVWYNLFSVPYQENQAFRARRREETQGTDDPVLKCHWLFYCYHLSVAIVTNEKYVHQ